MVIYEIAISEELKLREYTQIWKSPVLNVPLQHTTRPRYSYAD